MFLKYRPVRLSDLAECQFCIRDGFAYNEKLRKNLVELWSELLTNGAASAAVIEDLSEPLGRRIVWFCLKVFVSEDYAQYLKTEAPPLVGRQVLASWLKGSAPVLCAQAIRKANSSGGLTMLVLNSGAPAHIMAGDKRNRVFDKVVDFTCYFRGGYRCNEMLGEYYDDFTSAWAVGSGLRLRTDYATYYEQRTGDIPNAEPRARLFGVTACEAAASMGTISSVVFHYEPPRLFFTQPQQNLLLYALLGETDEELATSLNLALSTVRKRWDSIYEQVAAAAPDLLPPTQAHAGEAKRGCEKKRRLMSYLRDHLEELRPVEFPSGR